MGTVPRTLPDLPSTKVMSLLRQPTIRISCAASIASPEGDSQGAKGHVFSILRVLASNLTSALLSSRLTKIFPLLSDAANSGPPPRATVPATFPDAASIAVLEFASPLNEKARLLNRP